jgi:heterodisulfide reductase subunit A
VPQTAAATQRHPRKPAAKPRAVEASGKPHRTALFLCHCGTNIDSVIDFAVLRQRYEHRPNVVFVDEAHFCIEQGLNRIRDTIRAEKIERVVVAACSPRLHGELLSKTVEEAGLNRGYLTIANIREQCSWVHWDNPAAATAKAQVMIDAALLMAQETLPLHSLKVPITQRVMVIGGGVAGVTTAINLAETGHKVVLVEKSGFLGGHMAKWDKLAPTLDCSLCILGPLMTRVINHPNVQVLTLSDVTDVHGTPGDYHVTVHQRPRYVDLDSCNGCNKCLEICPIDVPNEYDYGLGTRKAVVRPYPSSVPLAPFIDMDACVGCRSCVGVCEKESIKFEDVEKDRRFKVGAIVVATGFEPFDPRIKTELRYGKLSDVVTTPELERLLNPAGPTLGRVVRPSNGEAPRRVAFVQCVGSRDLHINRPYCSRTCCIAAVKEAVQLRQALPDTEVYIFYLDMRTFGKGFEELYERAGQQHHVTFIRGRVAEIEADPTTHRLLIRAEDTELCQPIELAVDLAVLSVGMDANPTNAALAALLNVPLDENHYFLEQHPKLDPTGTYSAGVFLSGTAQSPKDIADTVAHAGLAAAQAASLLTRRKLAIEVHAPILTQADSCEGCRLCEKACDAHAITLGPNHKPVIDELACTGCGACVAVCPTGALDLPGFTRAQLAAAVQAACQENPLKPVIVGFLCHWCAYAAADSAGVSRIRYPPQFIPIRVPCTGRLDSLLILEAFSQGADGVAVLGCHEQDCHHRTGVLKAKARLEKILPLLRESGVEPARIFVGATSASEGGHLAELVTHFVNEIVKLGPLGSELVAPVRKR